MVIPEARRRLHKGLDDLITGRITNLEFDEVYDELHCSPDRAVAEVAQFGWGLYSDSVTYRITEHYRIKPETRKIAERCLLFLETDLKYTWPVWPNQFWQSLASGLAYNLFPLGIALAIVSLPLSGCALENSKDLNYFLACGVPAFTILAGWYWLRRWSNSQDSPAWKNFWASGDEDAWPFHRRSEYQNALQKMGQRATGSVE
jgi:hypothetical protein